MKVLCLLPLLLATGCVTRTVYVDPPELPPLPVEVEQTCPPLPLVADTAIGTLALADTISSSLYALCQTRGDTAVKLYNDARAARANAKTKK